MQETYEEKQVIEPEVIDNLPSVKKLAQIYGKEDAKPAIELEPYKPKVSNQSLIAFRGTSWNAHRLTVEVSRRAPSTRSMLLPTRTKSKFLSKFFFFAFYFFYRNQKIFLRKVFL